MTEGIIQQWFDMRKGNNTITQEEINKLLEVIENDIKSDRKVNRICMRNIFLLDMNDTLLYLIGDNKQ